MEPRLPASSGGNSEDKSETFVYKLFRMLDDPSVQHLIAWTATGTSFVVANATELARDVLPKYFKHNNFSSYVRQLNMYGFHKINENPRASSTGTGRISNTDQIWEFAHQRFLRGRPDLLSEIKRKVVSSSSGSSSPRAVSPNTLEVPDQFDTYKQNQTHQHHYQQQQHHQQQLPLGTGLGSAQGTLFHSFNDLQMRYDLAMRELNETKHRLNQHIDVSRKMLDVIVRLQHTIGIQVPLFDPSDFAFLYDTLDRDQSFTGETSPSIIVSMMADTASSHASSFSEASSEPIHHSIGAYLAPNFAVPGHSLSPKMLLPMSVSLPTPQVKIRRSNSYSPSSSVSVPTPLAPAAPVFAPVQIAVPMDSTMIGTPSLDDGTFSDLGTSSDYTDDHHFGEVWQGDFQS